MRRTKGIYLFLIALFILLTLSCSKDKTTAPNEDEVVVPETTEVIEPETANSGITNVTSNTLSVDPESDLADLDVGDIIITDVTNYASEGMLKKITSKNTVGNSVQFGTEQASLAEAVQELELSETYQLRPDQVRSMQLYNGAKYGSSRDDLEFMIDLDCIFYDQDGNYNTTDDQITLTGDFDFTASLFTDIEISMFHLEQFEIGIESNRDVNLDLNANLQWEFNDELTFDLAQFDFSPITFFVGIVPVVITPELVVQAHVHGDLTVTFTTGIDYTEDVRYGVGYEEEDWYQIKESSKTFNYDPPQFTTEFNFDAGASLRLNTFLYGVGGPYVRAKASFEFQSVLFANPSETHLDFTLDAVLYAICGIYMEVLDHTILDENIEFNIYTQAIGEWEIPLTTNNPPNSPSSPNPVNNAVSVSTGTDLSWSCTDPDGDPLTYDVYFGTDPTPDSGELVSTNQSAANYNLGTLNEETTYYWKIVAYDDYSHSTEGAVWQFTTYDGGGGGDFEWCTIPAGDYTYGDPPVTQNISYNFQIMKYEVTNQQYVDYLQEALNAGDITVTSSTVEGYYEGDDNYSAGTYEFLDLNSSYCRIDWDGSCFTIISGYEDHPVVEVTWFGSWAFAEHYGFSLLTEQEWEKAARGNTGYDYPWGNSIDGSRANYYNSGDPWDNGTTPVGMYNGQTIQGFSTTDSPSPYGVYDLAGNVWEWTDSWWSGSSSFRVLRGGSWGNSTYNLHSWIRGRDYPYVSGGHIGFRCVVP